MKHKNIEKPDEQKQKEQQSEPAGKESEELSRQLEELLTKKHELLKDVLLKQEEISLIDALQKQEDKLLTDTLSKREDKLTESFRLLMYTLLKKNELLGKLQRVTADYLNFQKRAPRQIADAIEYEKKNVIKTLLPVLDNLEHTIQNSATAQNAEVLVEGIKIIYDQTVYTLKLHNVEQIKAVGEKFDPSLHEAITQKADPQQEADIVLEELQKGYRLNGQVIRPSRVIVNKLPVEQKQEVQKQATDKNPQTDTEKQ
jgi:molecular chaperone GrpE